MVLHRICIWIFLMPMLSNASWGEGRIVISVTTVISLKILFQKEAELLHNQSKWYKFPAFQHFLQHRGDGDLSNVCICAGEIYHLRFVICKVP